MPLHGELQDSLRTWAYMGTDVWEVGVGLPLKEVWIQGVVSRFLDKSPLN